MHDNPQVVSTSFFALPRHRIVTLCGPDAAAFAQAQFINDVNAITPGQWQWSGWLTPKGRVIALFAVLKLDDHTLWLLLPDADPMALTAQLQRFVFRSKLKIAADEQLQVGVRFAAPDGARGNEVSVSEDGAVELDMGGDAGPRCLRIAAGDVVDEHVGSDLDWAAFDIEHGLPRLPASQIEQWTPQQLSLERLRGFSVRKGCYPGQEIVARTHFLGKAKRGLGLLEAEAALVVSADVHAGDKAIGTVVAVASVGQRHLGLAVLPLERESPVSTAGGMRVREVPLKGGLAR
ncbi:MAG: folate-binding protein [Pseudomonadota bacterium]|nr:folate-binding protein [Pseudomonadota bacterium]